MRTQWVKLIMVLVVGSVVAVAYAAQQLSIGNTGSISNVNTNLFMVFNGVTASTTCSTSTGTYADTGLSLTWNVPVGGSQTQYACLENTGSGPDALSIVQTGLPTGVTFAGSSSPASVSAGGFALVTLTVADTLTNNANTPLSFVISIR